MAREFSLQASIDNVLDNAQLIVEVSERAGIVSSLARCCLTLYEDASGLDLGNQDMVAVIRAIETTAGNKSLTYFRWES